MKRVLSIVLCMAIVLSCMSVTVFSADTDEMSALKNEFSQYLVNSVHLEDDGYIGIPMDISVFAKGETTSETQVIFYIINSSMERVGTDSDIDIVGDFLDEGYIVAVFDYLKNPLAVSPDIDWSIQDLRMKMDGGLYMNSLTFKKYYNYVVPAGYRVERDIFYWSITENGPEGIEQAIVDVWNGGFKENYGDSVITYEDGTTKTVSEVEAVTIDDCVKPDGSPLDMNLRFDMIYPSNPENEVPVMFLASSAETRIATWSHSASRPHMTGFLMQGYAGVVYDYFYAPMGRNDHYGWWAGCEFGTYSAGYFNTAAVRKVRLMASENPDKYKFDTEKFGSMGHSKSGQSYILSNPEPEKVDNVWIEGQDGTHRPQPWLTYSDGTDIAGNVAASYSSAGGDLSYYMTKNSAPSFFAAGKNDWGSWNGSMPGMAREAVGLDIANMYFTMPEAGHDLVYGYHSDLQCDMYQAYFDFMNYYLKDMGAAVSYITPANGSVNVYPGQEIQIKFSGPVDRSEIENKVTVKNAATGKTLSGSWRSESADTTWYFKANSMEYAAQYSVNVPAMVRAKNGVAIKSGRKATFKTLIGVKEEADSVIADVSGTSTVSVEKTSEAESRVFVSFDTPNLRESSSAEEISFTVVNDAAQRIEIYGVENFESENKDNSTIGDLIAVVPINGKGNYTADVSDYISSLEADEAAVFMLAAQNETKENELIGEINFDDKTSLTRNSDYYLEGTVDYDYTGLCTTVDHTTGSGKSFMAKNDTYNYAKLGNILKQGKLSGEDLGRKFHIEFYARLEKDGSVRAGMSYPYYGKTDARSEYVDFEPLGTGWVDVKESEWTKLEFDWRCDTEDKANSDLTHGLLSLQVAKDKHSEVLYADDIKVYETVTPAVISTVDSGEEDRCAISLVTHPKKTEQYAVADEAYVESGDEADTYFDAHALSVSGVSSEPSAAGNKKTYVKVDIAGLSGTSAKYSFTVKNDVTQEILVYGINQANKSFKNWSADTINWNNAPANDRNGGGLDLTMCYGGAPIDTIKINGSGVYEAQIGEYAAAMAEQGFDYATLVFVSNMYNGKKIIDENFDGATISMTPFSGGGGGSILKSSDFDHTSGKGSSYKFFTDFGYCRMKWDVLDYKNLTEADLGRTFKLSFWGLADAAGTFNISLQSKSGTYASNSHYNTAGLTVDEAGVWKKYEYEFTIDSTMLSADLTAETRPTIISLRLSKLGDRASGGVCDVNMYFDDITLVENGISDAVVTSEIIEEDENVTISHKFDSGTVASGWLTDRTLYISDTYDICAGGDWTTLPTVVDTYDHTTGIGKSLYGNFKAGGRVKFYNVFDHVLTEDDIGDNYKISFWLKTKPTNATNTQIYYGMQNNYSTSAYAGNSFWQGKNFTPTDSDWTKYEFDLEITEDMLSLTANTSSTDTTQISCVPGMFAIGGRNCEFWLDDVVAKKIAEKSEQESTDVPYSMRKNFDSGSVASGWLTDRTIYVTDTYEICVGGDWTTRPVIDGTADHTTGSGKSLHGVMKNGGRVRFYNIFDHALTEDDIGDNYKISFWLKTKPTDTTTKSIYYGMQNNYSTSPYASNSYWEGKSFVPEEADWTRYEYNLTITKEMLSVTANTSSTDTTQISCVPGMFTIGGRNCEFWLDDVSVSEIVDGYSYSAAATQMATISDVEVTNPNCMVGRASAESEVLNGIGKSYIRFAGGDYANSRGAALNFNVSETTGQTVKVYAVDGLEWIQNMTFNTAPANENSQTMVSSGVFGGDCIAEINVTEPGSYSVDVSDYVKKNAPNDSIFVFATDESGARIFLNDNLKNMSFSENADYVLCGEGSCEVSKDAENNIRISSILSAADGIKILNVFSFGGLKESDIGKTVNVKMTLRPETESDTEAVSIAAGLCTSDKDPDEVYTTSISTNASTEISFDTVIGEEWITNGVNALSVCQDGAAFAESLVIESITVSEKSESVIESGSAVLVIENEIDTTLPAEEEKQITVNVTVANGNVSAKIGEREEEWENLYTGSFAQGTLISLSASPESENASFLYWIDKRSDKIVSLTEDYEFTVGSDISLWAVYASYGEYYVTFTNANMQVLANGEAVSKVEVPSDPYILGYVFDGWYANGEKTSLSAGDIVEEVSSNTNYQAGFIKNTDTYKVTVSGANEESGEYSYNEKLTLTAQDKAAEGLVFNYWTKDGKIVSYNQTYSFYVSGDCSVEAVYAAEIASKKNIVSISSAQVDSSRMGFFAEYDISEEFTVIEMGILMGAESGLDFESADFKAVAGRKDNKGQYTVRKKNLAAGDEYYAKAYVIYTDGTENYTIYSEEIMAKMV